MFRKIHSNRDPGVTLWSELSREFAVYISRFKSGTGRLFRRKPGLVFGMMVFFILISFSYVFVICGSAVLPAKQPAVLSSAPLAVPEKGFGQIMKQADALKESLAIKAAIEMLIEKDSLTAADSAQLEKAINRLHELSTH